MLNEVSCWYVDWNAIGTWVGGLGSILAAAVAVGLAMKETRRRRDFARYLLTRDVVRLSELAALLRQSANAMNNFSSTSGDDEDAEILRDIGDKGLQSLTAMPNKLELFGRSDRLYDLGDTSTGFEKLNAAVNVFFGLDELLNWTFKYHDEGSVAEEINKACAVLEKSLAPYLAESAA